MTDPTQDPTTTTPVPGPAAPPATPATAPPPAASPPPPAASPPPPAATAAPVAWAAPPPEAGPAPGFEFGGFGARLGAYILDVILVTAIVSALVIVGSVVAFGGTDFAIDAATGQIVPGSVEFDGTAWAIFGLLVLIATIIGVLYFPWFWARGGQTPGMRPFGLYVVRDTDGSRIGWGPAFLRLIGYWVSGVVFYLGFIWIFIDKRRRGWHDLIAGTVVIRRV